MTTLAIIGAGKMGEAILSGLLSAGWTAGDLAVVEADQARAQHLHETYGVTPLADISAAASYDAVLVSVKPQHTSGVALELADGIDAASANAPAGTSSGHRPVVISVAAGVPCALFERLLPAGTAVVRVMPNTPALVGEAMSAIAPGAAADNAALDLADQIFAGVGKVVRVRESQLDAVTAISGSGPAYFFYLAELLITAGIEAGLTQEVAADLVIQTAIGAATMLRDGGADAATLRQNVTSPGGTTAAALEVFASRGLPSITVEATRAAAHRSVELGAQYG